MDFYWPALLWSLLLIPILVGLYLLEQRQRRRYALRYASLTLVREAIGKGPGIRRHIPPLLVGAALALMLVATARPYAVVRLPSQEGTVVLAIDVSGSMRAADVLPDRMEAAKAAAKAFVEKQGDHVRIGVVAFTGDATIVQAPTADKDAVAAAIDRLQPQRATAIGRGMLVSLDAIFAGSEEEPPSQKWLGPSAQQPQGDARSATAPPARAIPVAAAAIVLLTDGQNNQWPPPLAVADEAAQRGVKVYTIGLGTKEGTILRIAGRAIRTSLDEDTLKAVAQATDAEYFNATSAEELKRVYSDLATTFVLRTQKTEITALFAAAAVVLTVLAAALSLRWFGRIV